MSGASFQALMLIVAAVAVFAVAGVASVWLVKKMDVGDGR